MKRWLTVLAILMLSVTVSIGCKQQIFMTQPDLEHYRDLGITNLESSPSASIIPATSTMQAPATVLDPEREIRYVTLSEALASSLERGTTGVQSPFFPGSITDSLVTFGGTQVGGSDSIRVLALQPAMVANNIEASLSKFDARWIAGMNWNTSEQPVGTALQTFQAQANPTIQQNQAAFNSTLLKPLPTGGIAGITFNTSYALTNLNQRVNPAYQPALTFSFEQPLLQGFGTEINQLRTTHPGSILNPYSNNPRVEGVLITRIRFDQQRAEFERNINFTLVNVEIAYWNLYGSYWTLYSREQALRQSFTAWKINKARYDAGRINLQDYAQTRQQYESFRGQRLSALGDVLEKERQLRGFMGLPPEDGTRLVPIDTPTLSPYVPDWATALNDALALRPELVLAREDLKFRQLDLISQKNLTMPDLRFVSQYGYAGLGNRLDGGPNNQNNAFASLASGNFTNWALGLQVTMPLGFRDANAAVRTARLALAQSYAVLQDQEQKASRYLAYHYRKLFETYEQIKAQRAQREAAAVQLAARSEEYYAGRGTLDILLEAQRVWADALKAEYDNIVSYNSTLAGFEFAKGTIMEHDNVVISEGPLPHAVLVRAVDHEQARARAIILRERANPIPQPPTSTGNPGLPILPTTSAPSLGALPVPALLERRPNLPEVPSALPAGPSVSLQSVAPASDPRLAPVGQPMTEIRSMQSITTATSMTPPANPTNGQPSSPVADTSVHWTSPATTLANDRAVPAAMPPTEPKSSVPSPALEASSHLDGEASTKPAEALHAPQEGRTSLRSLSAATVPPAIIPVSSAQVSDDLAPPTPPPAPRTTSTPPWLESGDK